MTRRFEHFIATRESVPTWLSITGPSGSGKTYTALRVATGMAKVLGGKVWCIDTEKRRALHYADTFQFQHVPFVAPFASLDYLDAVRHCVEQKARVVIIDSASHEHEGDGGYLYTQESELTRMAGEDWGKRERAQLAAWVKPSRLRSRMLQGLMQLDVSIIFCFRAKERVKPLKNADGKLVPTELGWSAIGGETLIYEMTASCLLPPRSGGRPLWHSDYTGERAVMKLPKQFVGILDREGELNEGTGEMLARWAKGEAVGVPESVGGSVPANGVLRPDSVSPEYHRAYDLLDGAASHGVKVLGAAWKRLSAKEQKHLKRILDDVLKPRAQAVG